MDLNEEEVCELLDKLCIDTLTLMEEEIQLKVALEKVMSEGESSLAKCRYIMGSNFISATNIPLNSEVDIDPLVTVTRPSSDTSIDKEYQLSIIENTKQKLGNPLQWFTSLPPQNLLKGQSFYRSALKWVVDIVNIQNQLIIACDKFAILKQLKLSLKEE